MEFVCPFDITILHKTLAPMSRVIRNNKKSIRRFEKNGACLKNLKIKTKKTKRNWIDYCCTCNNWIVVVFVLVSELIIKDAWHQSIFAMIICAL